MNRLYYIMNEDLLLEQLVERCPEIRLHLSKDKISYGGKSIRYQRDKENIVYQLTDSHNQDSHPVISLLKSKGMRLLDEVEKDIFFH